MRISDWSSDVCSSDLPTEAEMTRLRTSTVASFVRSLESISGKASLLAESQTYLGSPDGWQAGFARYRAATPKQLQDAGRNWLSDGDYVLRILDRKSTRLNSSH